MEIEDLWEVLVQTDYMTLYRTVDIDFVNKHRKKTFDITQHAPGTPLKDAK